MVKAPARPSANATSLRKVGVHDSLLLANQINTEKTLSQANSLHKLRIAALIQVKAIK